jgi:hypothetical protein
MRGCSRRHYDIASAEQPPEANVHEWGLNKFGCPTLPALFAGGWGIRFSVDPCDLGKIPTFAKIGRKSGATHIKGPAGQDSLYPGALQRHPKQHPFKFTEERRS